MVIIFLCFNRIILASVLLEQKILNVIRKASYNTGSIIDDK